MTIAPFDGKVTRFFTSMVLPIDKIRSGECDRCGACCKFWVECPFLKSVGGDERQLACRIYKVRPLQCRKYPRTEKEQIHHPCGYRFGEETPREPI